MEKTGEEKVESRRKTYARRKKGRDNVSQSRVNIQVFRCARSRKRKTRRGIHLAR